MSPASSRSSFISSASKKPTLSACSDSSATHWPDTISGSQTSERDPPASTCSRNGSSAICARSLKTTGRRVCSTAKKRDSLSSRTCANSLRSWSK